MGRVIRETCDRTTTDFRARGPRTTFDWALMFCNRLAINLPPVRDRLELPVWLGKSLHGRKKIKSDLRPIYDRAERHTWITTNPQRLVNKGVSRRCHRVGSLPSEIDKFHDRFWLLNGRGACRCQWRVGLRYCEYSGKLMTFWGVT